MVRGARDLSQGREMGRSVVANATARRGGRVRDRLRGLWRMGSAMVQLQRGLGKKNDPVRKARAHLGLPVETLRRIDLEVQAEVQAAVDAVRKEAA